jgi:hypothetical protein
MQMEIPTLPKGLHQSIGPKAYDHECHAKLEPACHPFRNSYAQNQRRNTYRNQRSCMAQPPKRAHNRGSPEAAMLAHDSRHCHDVIYLSGVFEAKSQPNAQHRKYT